jgi:ATP-dependent helicase HrpB
MPTSLQNTDLPVAAVLDELRRQLGCVHEVILEAPPGAGKTTLVPLVLLAEPWLGGQKILMLEPRRLAARSAAHRLAATLGEAVGETVGYRMRQDTRVGRNTRLEIITEGILTRMLQQDPALEGVGLVIFDEYHERNLDADLALSLCLHGRQLFRGEDKPLKLLLMSATLDTAGVSAWLDGAPVVSSAGKQFPVEVIYGRPSQPRESIVDRTIAGVIEALEANPDSSVLVFLPGQGEISRVHDGLQRWLVSNHIGGVVLCPLYGNLSLQAQQAAIAPLSGPGQRKVVLATNIAETSLTIEGVDVVVDAGLAREPVFDPGTGMTRLQIRKISRSSAVQRMGRAGRLRPGRCYRLWSEAQQALLAQQGSPEILNADLASLALQLLHWGVQDPAELRWMDPPPTGAWQQALALLTALGAITPQQRMTPHGTAMAGLPLHPRLAHLLLRGAAVGHLQTAALLASLLSERHPLGQDSPDISQHLAVLSGELACPVRHQGWATRTRELAGQFARQVDKLAVAVDSQHLSMDQLAGFLLACAYPDRIARRRHAGGFQLANGRGASFAVSHYLAQSQWLALGEVSGGGQGDVVRSGAALDAKLFESLLADLVTEQTVAEWDKQANRFVAERRWLLGVLVLRRETLSQVPLEAKQDALLAYVQAQGLGVFSWTPALRQWQARVDLVRAVTADPAWPDLSDGGLLLTLRDWLLPYLEPVRTLAGFRQLDLAAMLAARLSWAQAQALNSLAPARLQVPSGSLVSIDYTKSPPVLAVKLQEMFGCEATPQVVNGRVSLLVHLLSPAGRPLQVTQDLAGFWRSSYHDVKKDMKGRYPKHPWPDDPLAALPTRKVR